MTLAIITVSVGLLGCLHFSRITSAWKAKDIPVRKYNEIMLLRIIRKADLSLKGQMKNHIVGDIK